MPGTRPEGEWNAREGVLPSTTNLSREDDVKKLLLLAAVAVGYVLGSRAGRGRYEQIKRGFLRVKDDPRVQEKSHQAADLAKETATVATAAAVDKAQAAAAAARDKVTGGSDDTADESGVGWAQTTQTPR